MFKSTISQTPFSSATAEDYFNNIDGRSYNGDYSFISTLRTLVAPRMQENDTLTLYTITQQYRMPNNLSQSSLQSASFLSYTYPNTLNLVMFACPEKDAAAEWLDYLDENFTEALTGWHKVEKVTEFFRKSFRVLCFIDPEFKRTVLFTVSLSLSAFHYLQCGIFAYLPWYFDPANGASNDEMELIESLRGKDPVRYIDCLKRMAEAYDFRTNMIKRKLKGFETTYELAECETLKNRIRECIGDINALTDKIGLCLRAKSDYETTLMGLELKIAQADGESEIMDYFLRNKNISLINVTGTKISFCTKGYLEYFDDDMAKRTLDNPSSYFYRYGTGRYGGSISTEDMKLLLTALFVDRTLKVKTCAAYELDTRSTVHAIAGYNYGTEYDDCTPNPHTDEYSCMGNYVGAITELLSKRDYIGAVEQCIASCRSLNFSDSVVMTEFMKRMYGTGDRSTAEVCCIELPDKTPVTPKTAIEWLKNNNNNTTEGE